MKKLLIVQHVPYEPLGTLTPLLKAAGFRLRFVNFSRRPTLRPRLGGYHGLVVLGGPMSVLDEDSLPHLKTEQAMIGAAVERGMPVLGICLGAQLLAKTLGGKVSVCPRKEIGWHSISLTRAGRSDPLLHHLGASAQVFQWHSDTFEPPASADALACSSLCEYQAFRYGDNVYGFQFHLEADAALIERWLTVPAHRRELKALPDVDPAQIRRETGRRIETLQRLSRQVFSGFIDLFGQVRRPHRHLPSR